MRLRASSSPGTVTAVAGRLALAAICCLAVSTQAGCLGLLANLMHASGASKIPAAYEGLEESRVAVVTITEDSQFGDDVAARLLAQNVSQLLAREIKDIRLVRQDEIASWRDTHGWDQIEFAEIGRGVDADQVLAIEVSDLQLRDGATLYRGTADVHISVIKASTGDLLFHTDIEDFTYPKTAGVYTNETTEARFRKLYLRILGKRVARQFYPYDATEDFAMDSIVAR